MAEGAVAEATAAWVRAEDVVADGVARGAERVCFRVDDAYVFTAVDHDEVAAVIADSGPRRYKFQRREDGRWSDLGRYLPTLHTGALRRALGTGDLDSLRALPVGALARATDWEPHRVAAALGGLERRVVEALHPSIDVDAVADVHAFLVEAAGDLGDAGEYLLATVDLLVHTAQAGLVRALDRETHDDVAPVLASIDQLVASRPARWETPPRRAALALARGRLVSLVDRDAAASHFREAVAAGAAELGDVFAHDRGATTYFTAAEVSAVDTARTREIRNGIVALDHRPATSDLAVLVSVDEAFYRIYAPQLLFTAQQLPGVDFTFLLCGSEDPRDLVADGEAYGNALATLNRSAPPRVSHLRTAVPAWVSESRTFYASARFYAVQAVLERYPRVYLMDADLSLRADPTAFFERLRGLSFSVPRNRRLLSLWPWRRFGAGNAAFDRGVLDTPVLDDLQSYLTVGLSQERSWTLDQNALAYAAERNPAIYRSLNSLQRPFFQSGFRSTWERAYFRQERDS